jgi:energy-coupling factor transporter transmembrane protein EcfT
MNPREAVRRRAAPLLLGALVGALVAGRPLVGGLCAGVAAVAAWAAGAGMPRAGWWRTLLISSALALVLNAYLLAGRPLGGPVLFGVAPSLEGLKQGALLALRLFGAALAIHGLRAAWPGERAADEIASRLLPLERLGLPVRRARAMVGLALRFLPLLSEEWRRVNAIQALRAGSPPRGIAERLVRMRAVAMPALVGALERADQLALALEARHFRLREPVSMPAPGWAWRGAGWALAGVGLLWR